MFLSLYDVNWTLSCDRVLILHRMIKPARGGLDDHVMQDTGGAYRDRTDDLLNANQALSQLS
jgi:hypothetical protein